MASLDVFNDDAFGVTTLSAAINEVPFQPTRLTELGLFRAEPVETTTVWVERDGDQLKLVKAGLRGAPGEALARNTATAVAFKTKHLKRDDGMQADEIQNARAFGTESELQTVQGKVLRIAERHRRDIETTLEYHRIGAIKGQILDSDGTTVLEDLYTKFGVVQQTHDMNLDSDTTDVRVEVVKAKRKSENVLGGSPMRGFRVLCGDDFFDGLIGHPELKAAYDRWLEGEMLRNDPRAGFSFAGAIWENYRGSVGGTTFIGTNDAYLVPEGVPDLFVINYAPADYVETVNTPGLPFYVKTEPRRFNTGVDIQVQSNPLALCTRPRAIIKLTRT